MRTNQRILLGVVCVLGPTLSSRAAGPTGSLRPPGVGAIFAGDFQKIYDFKFGTPGVPFGTDFLGRNLAPGESFQFNFGRLTPIGGSVAPGTYLADPAFLNLDGPLRGAQNTLQVTVVPVPSSAALLSFAGVADLVLTRLGPLTP